MQRSHPWVDIHAHPGRCFMDDTATHDTATHDTATAGTPAELGRAESRQAIHDRSAVDEIRNAGLCAVSYSTVADLAVLGLNDQGGLGAVRAFHDGEAVHDHLRQLDRVARIAGKFGLPIALRVDDIEVARAAGHPSLILMCEGADFAEHDLTLIADAHSRGVRAITIVHYRQNAFGDLQTEPPLHGGLSAQGRALVTEMNRLGMIVDLAHASFETTYDAVEVSRHPVMISHSHLRRDEGDHPRLVSLEHAKVVADAGGLVGAWPSGVRSATFEDFVDEVICLVEAIGVEHVAIGTDMDANYRPVMTKYEQFHDLARSLEQRGMSKTEIDRVLGVNALELLKAVCG